MTLPKVNTIESRGISQKDRSSENEDACNRVGRAERTTESCAWSKPNLLTSTRTGVLFSAKLSLSGGHYTPYISFK